MPVTVLVLTGPLILNWGFVELLLVDMPGNDLIAADPLTPDDPDPRRPLLLLTTLF